MELHEALRVPFTPTCLVHRWSQYLVDPFTAGIHVPTITPLTMRRIGSARARARPFAYAGNGGSQYWNLRREAALLRPEKGGKRAAVCSDAANQWSATRVD